MISWALFCGLLAATRAQLCSWADIDSAQGATLDLSFLYGKMLLSTANSDGYEYGYSPCRNQIGCGGTSNVMAVELSNGFCEDEMAMWDQGAVKPVYERDNRWFKFHYTNGQHKRDFYIIYKCDNYSTGFPPPFSVVKRSETGDTSVMITTNKACIAYDDSDTSTMVPADTSTVVPVVTSTMVPAVTSTLTQAQLCTWTDIESAQGTTLDLSFLYGKTLLSTADSNGYEYGYSPCRNQIGCGGTSNVMAVELSNGFCEDEMAVWDQGATAPVYERDNRWFKFHYTNGQHNRDFYILFKCDKYSTGFPPPFTVVSRNERGDTKVMITTNKACIACDDSDGSGSNGGDKGLSDGSILLITAIVLVFVYFVRYVYNVQSSEAKDWMDKDNIPLFPNRIIDSCRVVADQSANGGAHSGGAMERQIQLITAECVDGETGEHCHDGIDSTVDLVGGQRLAETEVGDLKPTFSVVVAVESSVKQTEEYGVDAKDSGIGATVELGSDQPLVGRFEEDADSKQLAEWFRATFKSHFAPYLQTLLQHGFDSIKAVSRMNDSDVSAMSGIPRGHCRQIVDGAIVRHAAEHLS